MFPQCAQNRCFVRVFDKQYFLFRLYKLGLSIANYDDCLLQYTEETDGTVFSCALSSEGNSDGEDDDLFTLEREV